MKTSLDEKYSWCYAFQIGGGVLHLSGTPFEKLMLVCTRHVYEGCRRSIVLKILHIDVFILLYFYYSLLWGYPVHFNVITTFILVIETKSLAAL